MTSAKIDTNTSRHASPPARPWQPEDLLSLAEAATYARMPYEHLRMACAERRMRHHRLSKSERGRILVRRRDLDAYIESLAIEPVTFTPPAATVGRRRERAS